MRVCLCAELEAGGKDSLRTALGTTPTSTFFNPNLTVVKETSLDSHVTVCLRGCSQGPVVCVQKADGPVNLAGGC